MQTATLIMALVLRVACKGQELCEIFPRNQNIRYGSDIIVSLKALPNRDCHNKTTFNTSRVYWTLNNKQIPKSFYDFNSTFVSVSIRNFTLAQGTIECLLDGNILGGAIFRSYYVLSSPQNVSCVGKVDFTLGKANITCKWDLDHTENTNYTVVLKQGSEVEKCTSRERSCTFAGEKGPSLINRINITVMAENPLGKAYSDSITYVDVWSIVKMDPPEVHVGHEMADLRVSWKNKQFQGFKKDCEVYVADQENGSYTEPVKSLKVASESTCLLTEVKPCTNYTISVCCKLTDSIWSTCSRNVSVLTSINVSHVQLHLWRTKSLLSGKGKRTVHLMWKGVPPSCSAFDEYRLIDHTHNFVESSFKPSQNHTFITLDDNSYRLSVAAFRNDTLLSETFIDIPSTREDLDLPRLHNVSVLTKNGRMHVTWDKPTSAVSCYIIVWNSTDKDHLWQQIQETQFSLKGKNITVYTISVSPIYKDGPGDEVRLDQCTQEGMPPDVSEVSVKWISDKKAEIQWVPALHTECCAFVVNYTVIYKTQDDPKPRNVTVGENQHSVILEDLRPSTVYSVQVIANAKASSSSSDTKEFSTKLYGDEGSPTKPIAYCVALALLPVFAIIIVMIRRKYLREKFPHPQFSSLSVWSSQNHRMVLLVFFLLHRPLIFSKFIAKLRVHEMPLYKSAHVYDGFYFQYQNPLTVPWDCEKIFPCQLDTESISISPLSRRAAKLKALKADQNTTRQEATNESEHMALASSPTTIALPSDGKQETTQPFPLSDIHTPGICPLHLSQSLYRNQTPLTSPVQSPRKGPVKPFSSEETEMLLKLKLQNANLVTTYVTVDVVKHGQSK